MHGSVEVDLRVGGRMTFSFPDSVVDDHGASTLLREVSELDPPRVFAFTWGEAVAGCASPSSSARARRRLGWHVCVDGLEQSLNGASDATISGVTDEWRERYEQYTLRGLPTGAPVRIRQRSD